MAERHDDGLSRSNSARLRRELEDKIDEAFGDGQFHSLDEILARVGHLIPADDALAAFDDGVEQGRGFGRRWSAGVATDRELARLADCHAQCGGDWLAWLDAGRAGLSPAEYFFRAVHPDRPTSGAHAWWGAVLEGADPEEVEVLEYDDDLLVAGFAEGAYEECLRRRGG